MEAVRVSHICVLPHNLGSLRIDLERSCLADRAPLFNCHLVLICHLVHCLRLVGHGPVSQFRLSAASRLALSLAPSGVAAFTASASTTLAFSPNRWSTMLVCSSMAASNFSSVIALMPDLCSISPWVCG